MKNIDNKYIGQCQNCGYALYEINNKFTTQYKHGCIEGKNHEVELIKEREKTI